MRSSVPFSDGNQIQGENLPPPETDGGGLLPEFELLPWIYLSAQMGAG